MNIENNSGWRSILTYGLVYKIVQFVFSEHKSKQLILDEFITPEGKNCKVLDMGCGPGNLLSFLPPHVNYIGFDVNQEYINLAKQRNKKHKNSTFIMGSALDALNHDQITDNSIDVVIIHGVLHHVTDQIAQEMFECAEKKLKRNGKMVVLEPVWFNGQSKFRKWVMQRDRGNNIKHHDEWVKLFSTLSSPWANISTSIEQNLIRFYDLIVLRLQKN